MLPRARSDASVSTGFEEFEAGASFSFGGDLLKPYLGGYRQEPEIWGLARRVCGSVEDAAASIVWSPFHASLRNAGSRSVPEGQMPTGVVKLSRGE